MTIFSVDYSPYSVARKNSRLEVPQFAGRAQTTPYAYSAFSKRTNVPFEAPEAEYASKKGLNYIA